MTKSAILVLVLAPAKISCLKNFCKKIVIFKFLRQNVRCLKNHEWNFITWRQNTSTSLDFPKTSSHGSSGTYNFFLDESTLYENTFRQKKIRNISIAFLSTASCRSPKNYPFLGSNGSKNDSSKKFFLDYCRPLGGVQKQGKKIWSRSTMWHQAPISSF